MADKFNTAARVHAFGNYSRFRPSAVLRRLDLAVCLRVVAVLDSVSRPAAGAKANCTFFSGSRSDCRLNFKT